MSLKAKLEAVIYAAEEPVTLAQLATLFTADALEWKAEQAAAAVEAVAENAPEPQFLPIENPDAIPEAEQTTAADESLNVSADEQTSTPEAAAETAAPAPDPDAIDDPEAEFKRQSRLRDREVRAILRQLLDEIITSYADDARGIEIREIAGGYRMATKPECHDAVRVFIKALKPALKLSLPALETLAVIAYKQPVTAPEVNEIRGVESGGVLGSLLSRKLIATAGRKQVIGRPILYKTTREFLLRFGLKDLSELPSMEEFEKMAAIELEGLEESENTGDETAAPNQEAASGTAPEFEEESSEDPHSRPITSAETQAEPEPNQPIEEAAHSSAHDEAEDRVEPGQVVAETPELHSTPTTVVETESEGELLPAETVPAEPS
jgi:segregation and condensation protein B